MQIEKARAKLSYLIIVVLYKCDLQDSSTIRSLMSCHDYFDDSTILAIWDNSPEKQMQSSILFVNELFPNCHYYHKGKNESLAVIYNKMICEHGSSVDFVNIWDQDSAFSIDYFNCLTTSRLKYTHSKIFVPKVYNNELLESPGHFVYFKGSKWKKNKCPELVSIKNNIAIMSGIVICSDLLSKLNFDERLKLYGIDTKFFIDVSKYTNEFCILNYNLKHSLSLYNKENLEVKLFRFYDFCYSSLIICEAKNYISLLLCYVFLIYHVTKNVLEYRNLQFFKYFDRAFRDWRQI